MTRIAAWALAGAMIPLAAFWVVGGADWFAKAVVCGPMPTTGIRDPGFTAWFKCVGAVVTLGTLMPLGAAAFGFLAWLKH